MAGIFIWTWVFGRCFLMALVGVLACFLLLFGVMLGVFSWAGVQFRVVLLRLLSFSGSVVEDGGIFFSFESFFWGR